MKPYSSSSDAAFRRRIRGMISVGPFTKSERDVVLAFFNFWLHHRSKSRVFCPGRDKISKTANVSVKTVSRTLAKMRKTGVITAIDYLTGLNRRATEYVVNVDALTLLCAPVTGQNVSLSSKWRDKCPVKCPESLRDKMSHHSYDVVSLSQVRRNKRGSGDA